MRNYLSCSLVLLLFMLGGCFLLQNPAPAVWFYTFSEGPAGRRGSTLTPASFIEFRSDGTYTRDFGYFDYGTWKMDRDNRHIELIAAHNEAHPIDALLLSRMDATGMQLILGDNAKVNFERRPLPKEDEDPFSLANNLWRIPAQNQQTDTQIRQRLFNHCQFWKAYFTWALYYKLPTVDVRSTPTPIKIYGNGFALKPYEEWPDEWKYSLNNKEDRLKAYEILKDIFEHKNIGWLQTDNKYEMFIGAFQQLENFLR